MKTLRLAALAAALCLPLPAMAQDRLTLILDLIKHIAVCGKTKL